MRQTPRSRSPAPRAPRSSHGDTPCASWPVASARPADATTRAPGLPPAPARRRRHAVRSIGSGMPSVSVPVLSKTTVSTSASRSSAVPCLMSSPLRNSLPLAAVTTAGTARPKRAGAGDDQHRRRNVDGKAQIAARRPHPVAEGAERQEMHAAANRAAPPGRRARCSASWPPSATATRSAIRCRRTVLPRRRHPQRQRPGQVHLARADDRAGPGKDRQAFAGQQATGRPRSSLPSPRRPPASARRGGPAP